MNYAEFQTTDRRLVILRGLLPAAQYRMGHYLLLAWCEQMGHSVSADRLLADLDWLAEQELITTTVAEGVHLATLTQRGLDVAQGKATVHGVQRPRPGAPGAGN